MASLQDIMNVDEEHVESRANKKDKDPTSTSNRQQPYPSSTSPTNSSYATTGDHVDSSSTAQGKRRTQSSRVNKSSATGSSSTSSSGRPTTTRRRSNTSTDSMDQPIYGHGHGHGHSNAGSSSGGYSLSNTPLRPFGSMSSGGEVPVKLTPITGRVSRARKGVPVHTCDICRPPKTFTRAEHLRRHQLSHQTPGFPCTLAGCDRAFHRKDLLERHQQRHELEGDKSSKSGGQDASRRTSSASLEGAVQNLGLRNPAPVLGYNPATSSTSTSDMPMTPSQGDFHPINSPGSGGKSMSPMGNSTDSYRRPSGHGYGGNGYTLSSQTSQHLPLMQHPATTGFETSSIGAPIFTDVDYSQPRTTPSYSPLYSQLPSLQIPEPGPPELSHAHDASAWPSSASDSTYSTPSDNSRPRYWPHPQRSTSGEFHGNLLSPHPFRDLHSPSGALDGMHGAGTLLFPFSASPQLGSHPVYSTMLDVPMPGFPDEQGLLDPHQQHLFPTSVRSPTPPPTATSAQSSETLVTPSTALPSDRWMNSLACLGRQKEVAVGLLAAPALMQGSLPLPPAAVCKAIPAYLDVYWEKFHHLFPIVHRRTFEAAAEQIDVLRCAMAAVATQYMSGKEDRIRGNQLHEYAWQQSRRFLQWDVSIMQAILLCELFARFRGRKAAIRPSREFESVYSRVFDNAIIFSTIPMEGHNAVRWHTWLDLEARRRLLSACFVLDVHTSVYQEQHRVRQFDIATEGIPSIPLSGPMNDLWEAGSADAWAALVPAKDFLQAPFVLPMIDPEQLTAPAIDAYSRFDSAILLASEALRLPSRASPVQLDLTSHAPATDPDMIRMASLFPNSPIANTYLALHYTPLHDLLAVSGDSWVFSQKVLHSTSFQEHQKRLKQWSNSGNAAAAVVFASRALAAFTANGNSVKDEDEDEDVSMWEVDRPHQWKDDISDYWGMYVCALICWAFGRRDARGGADSAGAAGDEEAALRWVRAVAEMQGEDVLKLRARRETTNVVGLVRSWLDLDCLGGRSRLFVDAVGVLKKLEEGVNWRWF